MQPTTDEQHPTEYSAVAGEVVINVYCPDCGARLPGSLVGSAEHGVRLWGAHRRYVRHDDSGDLEGHGPRPKPGGGYFANLSSDGIADDVTGIERGRMMARRVEWSCRTKCGFRYSVDRVTADAAFRLAVDRGQVHLDATRDI